MASTTATKIDLKYSALEEGSKQEIKFGPDDGAILIAKLKGEVYAVGAKCTHYGAPLKNGVLTSEGRLTCPWHGACFNIKSGDIEDAPALDALPSFKVEVKGEDIFVTAPAADVKSSRRGVVKAKSASQSDNGVVIVGGGAAGLACAEALRQLDYNSPITLLTKEPNNPIDRTKLSKAIITDAGKVALRTDEELKTMNITIKHATATKVDKENKKVQLEGGSDIAYDKLVLAPGAAPNLLPIDGAKLDGVCMLRDITHTQNIMKYVGDDKSKHVVILGGSFIGMEAATGLLDKAASITIIEPAYPLKPVLGEKVAQRLVKLHQSKGVKFVIGKGSVKTIKASDKDSSRVGSVLLENGSTLPADVLLMAVGVKPATEFLKSDFEVQKDGGLDIEQTALVKGQSDIYAVGDIARFLEPATGSYGRIEHWNVAQNLGRTAAKHIAGHEQEYNKTAYFWSAQQGKQLRYCGHATDYEDVVIQGSLEDLAFSAYYIKGDKVLAVASIGADPVVSQAAELYQKGRMLSASDIKQGKKVLDVAV